MNPFLQRQLDQAAAEAIAPLITALHELAAKHDRLNERVRNLTTAFQELNHHAPTTPNPAPEPQPPTRPHVTDRRGRMWLPEEDHIITRTYPRGGSAHTRAELAAAGHKRSIEAIYTRAKRLKLERLTGQDAVLDLLRDYRGMPLTLIDVRDELGMSRGKAKAHLTALAAAGLVTVTSDNQYAALWEEAA